MLRLVLAGIWVLLLSCSTSPLGGRVGGAKGQSSDLYWTDAQARFRRVSDVHYDLKVDLTAPGDEFVGDIEVGFDLEGAGQDLRLDFFEGQVSRIDVNATVVPIEAKQAYWIELPASALKEGRNLVKISYTKKYANDGQGLHRFKDPEDGQYYLHTQFEPNDAQKFMPCFDQPDLRSTLKLQVTAPKGWQVIATTLESKKTPRALPAPDTVTNLSDNVKAAKTAKLLPAAEVWDFPVTPAISTYLFSLHAGPYQMFRDRYNNIPLRIFVRPALAKHMNSQEWFRITKAGLGYFEKYFAVKYPFKKLDQVVAPEFNAGGMENVAAITYTENVLPRSNPTRPQRRGTAGLLMHEIAHMWFGDLVTMAWWNDLWLNESFATLMSSMAVADATEFKEEWQGFAANLKRGAYTQDAMSTTHPIEAPVTRVKEAMANFDGITYNKGASVMKQLRYLMTDAAFQKGIQKYMRDYSYRNTTLKDFIASLQTQTSKDLSLWADRWLRQSGTDQVSAEWTCQDKKLTRILINHRPSPGAKFRPQSLEIGLYRREGDAVKVANQIRADLMTEGALELKGDWTCPDFVYPNHNDHGYVNVKLDPRSLQFLQTDLAKVQDLLVRSLVWNDLWRMVRNYELPLKAYIEVVNQNFAMEQDEIILQQVVNTIVGERGGSILKYWPTTPAAENAKLDFVARMEKDFSGRLRASVSGSDIEKFWFDNLQRLARTEPVLTDLYNKLASGKVSPRFSLDLDRKWAITLTLARYQHPSAAEALQRMKTEDASDRGLKSALSVEAIVPDLAVKERIVREISSIKDARPLQEVAAQSYALFPMGQENLRLKFETTFFEYLEKNKSSEDESRVGTVVGGLVPLGCELANSEKLKSRVLNDVAINPSLKKSLRMNIEEDERCQKIRSSFN